jgi:hypothetical protein
VLGFHRWGSAIILIAAVWLIGGLDRTVRAQVPSLLDWTHVFDSEVDGNASTTQDSSNATEPVVVSRHSEAAIEPSERPRQRDIQVPSSASQIVAATTENELQELSQWIRWLALMNLPPNFEDNRKWGAQRKVYDGVDVHFEGLRLDTKRKWKMVNHGTWSRYFIEFVDPAHRLEIAVRKLESRPNGRSFTSQVQIVAPLKLFGRVSQFVRDVQLVSVSVQADATVALDFELEVEIRINPLLFPPEVEFRPRVTQADVNLREFEVHRISQIHGDPAEWIGQGIRKVLDRKLNETNDQLVEKINTAIAKQQHKLKLSAGDWLKSSFHKVD